MLQYNTINLLTSWLANFLLLLHLNIANFCCNYHNTPMKQSKIFILRRPCKWGSRLTGMNVKGVCDEWVWMSVVTVWARRWAKANEWKPKTNNKTVRWKQRSKKYVGSKLTLYLETFKPIKYSLIDSIKFILWSTKIVYQPKW